MPLFISNVLALQINAPVGKHQKESISGPHRFSKIHVFHVKFLDSSHGFSANQKDVKIQLLTQSSPTFDNGIDRLSHPVPEKYVCRDLITEIFRNLSAIQVSELQMSFVTFT